MAQAGNLTLRLATAVVGVPAILALLYVAPTWAFYLLVFPAALVGANELFGMTHHDDLWSRVVGVLLSAAASLAVFFFHDDPRVLVTVAVAIPLVGPLLTLARLGDVRTAALRACALGFGPLFVAVPLTLLAVLQRYSGHGWVILALGLAWISDTGAYFAGRLFGKHKLYEAVSPKKTVEGAIGGLVAAVGWAVFGTYGYLRGELPLVNAVLLAIVAAAAGQAGDLAESLIKRSTGVKDSGAIVPGHGGVLDRVDALIMTSGAVYLYVTWFGR
jgi:phosphatidate cytidylyltransferase